MQRIRNAFVVLSVVAFSTAAALADMPKELKGTWILDAEATEKYVQTSPKWKDEDAKRLPMIMKRMSQVLYELKDGAMIATMWGRSQTVAVTLNKRDGKSYVFDAKVRDQTMTMTVTFVSDATITIRSSTTDDMDYFLWKRGKLPKEAGPNDKALALEAMKKAMEQATAKPAKGK